MTAQVGSRRDALVGVICGLIFAGGLVLSGMTDPARVLGFLDFAGNWDPRLVWVMAGAIAVHFTWLRVAKHREGPQALAYSLPPSPSVDRPLLYGAALCGVGWGMAGYCPGPAVVSLGAGVAPAAVFTLSMCSGMYLFRIRHRRLAPLTGEEELGQSLPSCPR